MPVLGRTFIISILVSFVLSLEGMMQSLEDTMGIQREQADRFKLKFVQPSNDPPSRQNVVTFANPAAEQFFVDGAQIPDGTYELAFRTF
jgi:carboxypeptidase D